MQVNYSDQDIIKGEKSIFLAGPTPRGKDTISWRTEAVKILEDIGFDGIVYVPEYSTWKPKEDYVDQAMWERKGLENATVIAFWIPRHLPDMPAFTTNVEFGYWLHSGKVLYGRPDDAQKIKYLDWLYKLDYNKEPIHSLEELLKESVKLVDKKDLDILREILTSDNVRQSLVDNEETIFRIIPLLRSEKGFEQNNPWHMYDVWNHTIETVAHTSNNFELRLTMLLHDIGKPFSYQDDEKGRHFNGHALKSFELATGILSDLGIDEEQREEILCLIARHATKIDINLIDDSNIEFYLKLIDIQISDGSSYETEHLKMILEELRKTKEDIMKKVYKLTYK